MNKNITKHNEYKEFFVEIKKQIQNAQIKAALSVNKELLKLYWNIASMMIEKQKNYNWGDGFIEQIAKDLQNEFPSLKGFSVTNIKYMQQWCLFYVQEKSPQVVDFLKAEKIFQIPSNKIFARGYESGIA